MDSFAIDENVLIVANDASRSSRNQPPLAPQANEECVASCIAFLNKVRKRGIVVIDQQGEVISRYGRHLERRGQPGVGDAFYKYLVERQYQGKRVKSVDLESNGPDYLSFPNDPDLADLDRNDRIYVALAIAAPAIIANAVDSDYRQKTAPLSRNQVSVLELCSDCLKE